MPVEELRVCAFAYGVQAEQDLLQELRGIKIVRRCILVFVFLFNEIIQVRKHRIILRLELRKIRVV